MVNLTGKSKKKSKTSSKSDWNNGPTDRSRYSVIKGSRAFVWDREKGRSDEPYHDQAYHIPFDPPPNEVNFICGLGKRSGNVRSRLHPNRPTIIQKIYGMRNQNKIAVTFAQPAKETNCCVRRNKGVPVDLSKTAVNEMVKKVSTADFVESPNSSDVSDSSDIVKLAKKKSIVLPQIEENTIDGIPFYYRSDEIQHLSREFLKKNVEIFPEIPKRDEDLLREWAIEHRKKSKMGICDEPLASPQTDRQSILSKSTKTAKSIKIRKIKPKDAIKHITGYMYGPFTNMPSNDKLTQDGNKYNIPNTMLDRAKRQHKKQKIQENTLRKVRLSHMGFERPPSKEHSSDDESIQNVKKLALVRTPYCIIPTIKISRVRKKDRFRNKFLKKDRLRRINMYLNEKQFFKHRSRPDEFSILENVSGAQKQKQSFITKLMQLVGKKTSSEPKRKAESEGEKTRYLKVIRDKYREFITQFEMKDESKKPMSFAEYKAKIDLSEPIPSISIESEEEQSEPSITARSKSLSAILKKSEPKELFKRKKNEKLSKFDNIVGPFYLDPKLMDKFRSPKSFSKIHKYYTNLIKGKHFVRDRLQVNAPTYDEEQVGHKDKYYHRLATEWDNYYISELRHRPPGKKFNVKTDIMTIREVARKNFILYCVEENLLILRANQVAQQKIMDSIEDFKKTCESLFIRWKSEAYKGLSESTELLKELQEKNSNSQLKQKELQETMNKLNKDIFIVEKQFNYLLKIQNYYYLLQDSDWREEHDWIHRTKTNSLLLPLEAFQQCATKNIRPNANYSCGLTIQKYFNTFLRSRLDQMRQIQPSVELLKSNLGHLRRKTFNRIMQHNKTFWMYKFIYDIFCNLNKELEGETVKQKENIEVMSKTREFMLDRENDLKKTAEELLATLLPKAVKNPSERKIFAICDELYSKINPPENATPDFIDSLQSLDKFTFIHGYSMNLLEQMDDIPLDILKLATKMTKEKRRNDREQSKMAMIKQKRFELLKKQLLNQFTPTAKFKRVAIVTTKGIK